VAEAFDLSLASFRKASHPFPEGSDPASASSCPESSYLFASYYLELSISVHETGGLDAEAR